MRVTIYRTLLRLPFRLAGGAIGFGGIAASVWPEKVEHAIGGSEMTIQNVGIALLIVALVYVVLLAILKPGPSSGRPGSVMVTGPNAVINNYYANPVREAAEATIREEVISRDGHARRDALPSVVVTPPEAPASGSALLQVQDATSETRADHVVLQSVDIATGPPEIDSPVLRTISNLYTGQVIVSAARLADQNVLELGLRAFNGGNETLRVLKLGGYISAGIDNAAGSRLPEPRLPTPPVEPIPSGAEFYVVIDQPVSAETASEWLRALEENSYVTLDLRELSIVVGADDDPPLRARLPLWHGASIRRRDDIFTNRIFMASLIGMAVTVDTALALTPGTNNND